MSDLRKALLLGLIFAVTCAIAGLLNGVPWGGLPWQLVLLCVGSFGCFGFLLGGIYAFDPQSDLKIKSSTVGRMAFGIAAGLLMSALWRWSAEAAVLAVLLGAVLGYLGMAWLRFVE